MSIAVLNQVYDEARRLAVAGSVVARGDFRLKKLLPALDQAGARAPVFAKVAECARAVVDGPEESSAGSLLELTALVTAVLYTQGETGVDGELEPIETVDLGGGPAQTSARLLKPLLEALASTGSGRLDLIREAHERGAFRDLRLVRPALDGLDDPYPEIADFLAEKVLPAYGTAILPELRAKYDPKGTKGHPRRLKLMHALDPAGARDLVKQALEVGSKEVKVAAIACLGAAAEDLDFLIEQTGAKAQDVRRAAYQALASTNDPAAVAALERAIKGKDLELAAAAIGGSKNAALAGVLVPEIRAGWSALAKCKDRKETGRLARRLVELVQALPDMEHPGADVLVLDLFARRGELAKARGDLLSGSDVVSAVVQRMMNGHAGLRAALAHAHADLPAEHLGSALDAAWRTLPAPEVFEQFSPYLLADAKKGKDAAAKRDAVLAGMGANHVQYPRYVNHDFPPLDPRWVDVAVKLKHVGLLGAVGHRGHPAAEAFLRAELDEARKAKAPDRLYAAVTVMTLLRHPAAADALIAAYETTAGKPNGYTYWYHYLVPELPKEAVPKLEAVATRLKDRDADLWLRAVEELKER